MFSSSSSFCLICLVTITFLYSFTSSQQEVLISRFMVVQESLARPKKIRNHSNHNNMKCNPSQHNTRQVVCMSLLCRVRALITLHQSAHFAAWSLINWSVNLKLIYGRDAASLITLINDTKSEWKHDTVMDSPPLLIKLEVFDME